MPDCSRIDPLVTPFVDGELPRDEQEEMSRHLQACPPCRAKVAAERSIRALVQARRDELTTETASPALKARCALLRSRPAPVVPLPLRQPSRTWAARVRPFALAASLAIIVAGAFLYQATQSSNRVLAAELAMDHMKCFGLNGILGTHHSHSSVEAEMASSFDWMMRVPSPPAEEHLDLVGSRMCLYGEGRTAHIMFRHNGEPMSLFMLPSETRADDLVGVFGHNCRIWSAGDRTFVLVSREGAPEVERVASVVRASLR